MLIFGCCSSIPFSVLWYYISYTWLCQVGAKQGGSRWSQNLSLVFDLCMVFASKITACQCQ